ncbi:hypothetical protein [Acetivibrio cellulolyticus]|uniref:hypothetical protein n=1 Tax=Acetivibrio cellulolyticus TaxID=35830 RepID=UPI0001E2D880|nr:hypothetical protein [Acetivibrio cellulolyticus]
MHCYYCPYLLSYYYKHQNSALNPYSGRTDFSPSYSFQSGIQIPYYDENSNNSKGEPDGGQVYIDSDYMFALKTADKFLCAWIARNGSMAYDLLSDNKKMEYKDPEDFIIQFAGVSNPHNEAFEIAGDKRISKERIRFKVWLYYHVTGQSILPYKRPDNDVYIELVKVDERTWLVDKFPI